MAVHRSKFPSLRAVGSPYRHRDAFACQVTTGEGPALVQLSGELDMATAPEFVERAGRLVGMWPTIVLDLSRLTFCDSSGLHAFIELQRRCEQAGHRLVLRAPTPTVRRVLELARVDQQLAIRV